MVADLTSNEIFMAMGAVLIIISILNLLAVFSLRPRKMVAPCHPIERSKTAEKAASTSSVQAQETLLTQKDSHD